MLQRLGLTARLMIVSGLLLVLGGGAVLGALTARDAVALQAALQARAREEAQALAPLIADQAVIGGYALIQQILDARIRARSIAGIEWLDRRGTTLRSSDTSVERVAPQSRPISSRPRSRTAHRAAQRRPHPCLGCQPYRPIVRHKPEGQAALANAASIIAWVPRENSSGQA
jgi:hypothetical protein